MVLSACGSDASPGSLATTTSVIAAPPTPNVENPTSNDLKSQSPNVPFLEGQPDAAASKEQIQAVEISGFRFLPSDFTVRAGTTVTWTNMDSSSHTVTSADELFGSASLERDQTFAYRFDTPGTYAYRCNFYPGMRGTITVR